jgi:predicted Zn finger-like uncharacterized protein
MHMAITTTCPGCKAIFRLPDELAGQSVRCQKCERMFVVPLPTVGQGMPMPSAAEAEAPVEIVEESLPLQEASASEPVAVAPMPTLVEPIIEKKLSEELVPERPPSRLWIAAAVGLFLFAFSATGAFAAIWVAKHLAPPPRIVLVPPLKETNRAELPFRDRKNFFDKQKDKDRFVQDGKDVVPIQPKRPLFDKDEAAKRVDQLKPLKRYLVQLDANGRFEEAHAITASDPFELSAPAHGPYREYIVTMSKGQTYRIEMASKQFPPMLSLFDDQSKQLAHSKDAELAAMDFTANQTGTFRIRAIATHPFDRGQYSIKIMQVP